jgi:GT2 family glycosyltransferase
MVLFNQPKVSVIIVNYNSKQDTMECLRSLQAINYSQFEIVVVDNGSIDGSSEYIEKTFSNICCLRVSNNLGFAGGSNLGIKHALASGAKYLLLLNNDTIVDVNFLSSMINLMEKRSDIAAVNPKIYYYDKPNVLWFAGAQYDDRYPARESKHIGIGEIDCAQYDQAKEIQRLTGCCMLINRVAIENVGLLDEQYFCYVEDTDWCLRAKRVGYKLFYVPSSKIWHKVSASAGGEHSPLSCYYMVRNKALFLEKNYAYSKWRIILTFFPQMIKSIISIVLFRFPKQKLFILRAYFDYFMGRFGKIK